MRSIIAALAVLIGSSAAGQSFKHALPEMPLIEPEPIQAEQVILSESEISPDSTSGAVATNAIPDAPKPMPMTALIRAGSPASPRAVEFNKFGSNHLNRVLIGTEFLARGLDAASSYRKLNNPCNCHREASRFFGVDMAPVFKGQVGAYSYSFGVAAAYSIISAELWNAGKRHPRHARLMQRLSRSLLIVDSSMELATDFHNLSLSDSGAPTD